MNEASKRSMSNARLCCFANDDMSKAQSLLVESALNWGFDADKIFAYKKEGHVWEGFDSAFLEMAAPILEEERGCGYWVWKPYIIYRTMQGAKYGEWIVYLDSGIEIVNDLSNLIKDSEDFVLFNNEWNHMDWCKMDVMSKMLLPNFYHREMKQLQASAIFIKKNEYTQSIVEKWLNYCLDKHMIDDSPSVEPNVDTFREHRHDQAILTNAVMYDNIPTLTWDNYITYDRNNLFPKITTSPILFWHHRKRNNEF